ncbi:hypothetical protein Dsin_010453 [Dipteronia sinensis]|uniref:RNase H type-1 domain-containing protein n=1 Tax=Dipteronia sinensis TaxID=43782 RepID=A0AAE0ASU1_9ROSI|nr:hypothetical protein Dsin_010453 [Dipteronia sinensis]
MMGIYKVNFNAAVDSINNRTGACIIIRDYMGNVMGSSVQTLQACFSPKIVESTAFFRGILFAVESSLVPAMVEIDVKSVDLVILGVAPPTIIGVIIGDISSP